jgi:uncharacterized protein YjbI with pentapeptide repeats
MKIIKNDSQSMLTRVYRLEGEYLMAVTLMTAFTLEQVPEIIDESELWNVAGGALGQNEFLDVAMPKVRGELLVKGKFFSPGGKPAPAGQVKVGLGPVEKTLYVFGDRFWKKKAGLMSVITEPEPMTEMAITYENAFGGPECKENPAGKGMEPEKGEASKEQRPLPNIEDPKRLIGSPKDRPDPAGFAPLDLMHPDRMKKMGTYDDKWLKNNWPYFPDDFDWSYFNCAPEDQQIEEFFKGDEVLSIQNMHPQKPLINSALPGMRARCFINRIKDENEVFVDVKTGLDTVWLFPDQERGICVWHGAALVSDDEASDVLHLVTDLEPLAEALWPTEYYLEKMKEEEEEGELIEEEMEAEEDEELKAPKLAAPAVAAAPSVEEALKPPEEPQPEISPEIQELKQELEEVRKNKAEIEAEIKEQFKQLGIVEIDEAKIEELQSKEEEKKKKIFEDLGVDPDPPPPPELGEDIPPEDMLKGLKKYNQALVDRMDDLLKAIGVDKDKPIKPPTEMEEMAALPPKEAMAQFRKMDMIPPDIDEMVAELEAAQDEQTARINDMLAQIEALEPAEGPAPEDAAPPEMEPPEDEGKEEVETEVIPLTPELAKQKLEAGESLAGEDLTGMDLSGGQMENADLSGATLEGAKLGGADLQGANLSNAVLAGAVLAKAKLPKVNMAGCQASDADLSGADFAGADLSEADFTDADLTGADFTGANLEDAIFNNAKMSKAVFDKCLATRAEFIGADLTEASFVEADVTWADLSGSQLDGADFSKAVGDSSTYDGAKGKKVVFAGAGMKGSRADNKTALPGADFKETCLAEACWEGADLEAAEFQRADLFMADFTKCRLKQANFMEADARKAKFVKADLTGANMVSANLFRGAFNKTRLNDTDLKGANLYEAEFLRANIAGADFEGANLKMTKLQNWVPK